MSIFFFFGIFNHLYFLWTCPWIESNAIISIPHLLSLYLKKKRVSHRIYERINAVTWSYFLFQVPNPLFDLAGIVCGQFGIPFWKFFLATLIGKAIIKTHIQVCLCSNCLFMFPFKYTVYRRWISPWFLLNVFFMSLSDGDSIRDVALKRIPSSQLNMGPQI